MGARGVVLLVASVPAGVVELFLGVELNYIGGGDEGRWQPYVAAFTLIWGGLVALLLWPRIHAAALYVGLLAVVVSVATFCATLFALVVGAGYS